VKPIVNLDGVSLVYQAANGEVEALRDISLAVPDGQLVVIIGPSGCGKTTILSLIAGLETPTTGTIDTQKTGYMLQKDSLLAWRTIRGNVQLGLEIQRKKQPAHIAYADELLKTYGLWDFRDKHPHQLSGGMRQRAALIRTLATRPDVLLLDEAFSALDYQTRLVVAQDVYDILRKEAKTAVIVTHDISEGLSMADRIIVLSRRPGRILLDFPVDFALLPPMHRRGSEKFREYFNIIMKELDIK
jgi:NitT/TauT family transport system ATP-binding protein